MTFPGSLWQKGNAFSCHGDRGTHIHTHTDVHMNAHTYKHTHTHTHTHRGSREYTHTYGRMHARACAHAHARKYTHACAHTHTDVLSDCEYRESNLECKCNVDHFLMGNRAGLFGTIRQIGNNQKGGFSTISIKYMVKNYTTKSTKCKK